MELEGLEPTLTRLMPEARRFLIAVSGGADSVALLRWMAASSFEVQVAHLDHQLRPEAEEDAAFVKALAEDLDLAFHLETLDVAAIAKKRGWNLEDAGRRLRYDFLTRTAKAYRLNAVLTAHTLNDQAETVLMQMLRGAAYPKGMLERRGHVLRPLLGTSRDELRAYLFQLDQPFREDATNADKQFTRAWLRHEVLPLLDARFPGVQARLARLATLQQDVQAFLSHEARAHIQQNEVALSGLLRTHAAIQRQVIAELLKAQDLPRDTQHIEALLEHLDSRHPVRVTLSADQQARIAYGKLQIVGKTLERVSETKVTRAEQLPESVMPDVLTRYPELVLRSREAGDRIQLAGGTRKLSDLMIDAKVPREDRDSLRVLAGGNRVLWVEGLATAPEVSVVTQDERWMDLALEQAQMAFAKGELPVGAVVIKAGEVIAAAHNQTETLQDPTAHAEILALRQAAGHLEDWRLADCTLYVTLEPCPMCFGAILQAHLPQVVYGAKNHREGALGSVTDLSHHPWKRQLGVRRGVLANRCSRLLTQFFMRQRRNLDDV